MITFLFVFGIGGWITAFLMLRQRNEEMDNHSRDKTSLRDKVVSDLGIKAYVDFSAETNYDTFNNVVLNKVNLVLKQDAK